MHHRRSFTLLAVAMLAACAQPETDDTTPAVEPAAEAAPAPGTPEAKITEAMAAGPESITANATIMDWPATEGGQPTELRAGTNGWTCFANSPAAVTAADEDPMCLDEAWLAFANAWMSKQPPSITKIGIGYMLKGDAGASLTDPFATAATADNQWAESPPHLMIVTPDVSAYAGLPTEPSAGGPYVMWAGTPWAHIMVPVTTER
ncbi:MAG: hypothetical protein L0271_16020 [Gemmatimonadetes bacterium]|nr:hypothetical protein [Gemmatimonadota bacterium]